MLAPFTDDDVVYLVAHLNEAQLRGEIHWATISGVVAEQFRGTEYEATEDFFPYPEYKEACERALRVLRELRPKPKPVKGRIDVSRLKDACDILAVIEKYTKPRKVGSRYVACCPIHQDKHPSITIYPANQSWYCFGCNRGGDAFDFIQAVENTDFRGAAAILGGR